MHRFTNDLGIKLIKKFEGFRSIPYHCGAGFLTIGYGHKITAKQEFSKISKIEAEQLLRQDLLIAERAVIKNINTIISDNQFAALVSITFNIGSAALQRSVLRQKVNYCLWHEAINEFNRWVYIKGKISNGLKRRRQAEAKLFAA